MKKERVTKIIDEVAAGNNNLKLVMQDVYRCGKQIIDTWPEENTGLFVRKTLWVTSLLIHRRIITKEKIDLGKKYWDSENGIKVNEALTKYVETRINHRVNLTNR